MPPLKKLQAQELLPNVKVAIVAALGEGLFIYMYLIFYSLYCIYACVLGHLLHCTESRIQYTLHQCIGSGPL